MSNIDTTVMVLKGGPGSGPNFGEAHPHKGAEKDETVIRLPSGTAIGTKDEIDAWAANSAIKVPLYHGSRVTDKLLSDGFDLSKFKSAGDGIYFADTTDIPAGAYPKYLTVRVNVTPDEYADFSNPSQKLQDAFKDWEEEEGNEIPQEPGTIGPFMKWYGFKAWNDGGQYGVMDGRRIGIIR